KDAYVADLACAIALIRHREASWIDDVCQLPRGIVAVLQSFIGVGASHFDRANLLHEVATSIVEIAQHPAGILYRREAPDAVVALGRHVVVVLDVKRWRGRVLPAREAIQGIVAVGGDNAASVGL